MRVLNNKVFKRVSSLSFALVLAASTVFSGVFSNSASALSNTIVRPDTSDWTTAETRSNGQVNFVSDGDPAFGTGALQLITGANTGSPLQDKANIMHYFAAPVDLDTVTAPISYSTKQISASFAAGLPSFQIPVYLDGTSATFTTLVYEPYVDQGNGAVLNNVWQNWNVGNGKLWSSRSYPALNIVGSQGSTTYTLADIKTNFPDAVVLGFGVNVGSNNPYWDTRVDALTFNGDTYDFEPFAVPACSATSTFDDFTLGSVNGQGGWSSTGPFDQEVVSNTYNVSTFGCQTLRLSNGVTSGSFGDQTFSNSATNEAGETDATNAGYSGGVRQNHYEASFDIASVQAALQAGLSVSVSPDRGDGSRMSYLRFEDQADGIHVFFDDYVSGDFNETELATLSRSAHTIKFVIDFKDGASNDVVNIFIDGVNVHTGTTWEDYYREAAEQSFEQSTRTVDSLIFRVGGTAVPTNLGKGFLFDNVSIATSTITESTGTETGNTGGNTGSSTGSSTTTAPLVATTTPAITSPASVLGAESDEEGATDVEGTTDDKSNTDTDASNGSIFGLMWYWWILILLGATGVTWGIIAAIRRNNQTEN